MWDGAVQFLYPGGILNLLKKKYGTGRRRSGRPHKNTYVLDHGDKLSRYSHVCPSVCSYERKDLRIGKT